MVRTQSTQLQMPGKSERVALRLPVCGSLVGLLADLRLGAFPSRSGPPA
jgi:hypothetical protein